MKCANPVTRILVYDGSHWITDASAPARGVPHRVVTYPCGHCFACRINHSKQWAARCSHEAQMHDQNMFLNLTVNDESLPELFRPVPITPRQRQDVLLYRNKHGYTPSSDFKFDVLKEGFYYSLDYRVIQLFFKRLRKLCGLPDIKYFVAGEYGPANLRPHFHILVFGFRPDDLIPWQKRGKHVLFRSATIAKLWTNPITGASYGYSGIGQVTPASAQYCAQYSLKKQRGSVNAADYYGSGTPEFCRMSKGIGKSWFEEYHSDVFPSGIVNLDSKPFCSVPRYYQKLYKASDPDGYHAYRRAQCADFFEASTREAHYVPPDVNNRNPVHDGFYGPETYYEPDMEGHIESEKGVPAKLSAYYRLMFLKIEEAARIEQVRIREYSKQSERCAI